MPEDAPWPISPLERARTRRSLRLRDQIRSIADRYAEADVNYSTLATLRMEHPRRGNQVMFFFAEEQLEGGDFYRFDGLGYYIRWMADGPWELLGVDIGQADAAVRGLRRRNRPPRKASSPSEVLGVVLQVPQVVGGVVGGVIRKEP